MGKSIITRADEVYAFVAELKSLCEKHGDTEFAKELDDAMYLGSSGLEILGALKNALIRNQPKVEWMAGSDGQNRVMQVVAFVDNCFGM